MTDIDELKSRVNDIRASRGESSGIASLDAGGAIPPDELLDSDTTLVDITASSATVILVDASSINVKVTLPAASLTQTYFIKKIDESNNYVLIEPQSGEKIDNNDNIRIIVPYTCITIHSDGDDWWII